MTMTKGQIDEIRARANAATAGPWIAVTYDVVVAAADDGSFIGDLFAARGIGTDNDTVFVAHARTDVPALLDEIARLIDEVEAMRPIVEAAEAFADACDANLYDGEDIDTEPLLDTLRAACLAAAEATEPADTTNERSAHGEVGP